MIHAWLLALLNEAQDDPHAVALVLFGSAASFDASRQLARPGEPFTVFDSAGRSDPRAARRGSTELAFQFFFAADTSTQTIPLLPSWSAITVSEGALLSSTTVPPAATAAAIRCSATSGAT